MMQTYTFRVNGMHCKSCVLLTEGELKEAPGVQDAKTSLKTNSVEVTGEFGEATQAEVMHRLSSILLPHGYSLSLLDEAKPVNWLEFAYAVPLFLLFVAAFVVLQQLGIVNLVQTSEVTYGTAFIVGLIASVSTCMAVVGGLVLSMSANFAKEGQSTRPQLLFHVGRLGAFFVLGGAIGALGAVFQFGRTGLLVLGVVVALVLLILGLNLLDVPWGKRAVVTLPLVFGKRIQTVQRMNHVLTPLFVGVVTFFLPCGFTQSMQLYTLTTGQFMRGGLTMFSFALGTLPVLALLSFSSLSIQKRAQSGIFFKTAGLVVIFFAVFNLLNTLAGAGIIDPVFTF